MLEKHITTVISVALAVVKRKLPDACCYAGGQRLVEEDSTQALAVGSPVTPSVPRPANSEHSRQAVVLEAPLSIEYDVEVDCRT